MKKKKRNVLPSKLPLAKLEKYFFSTAIITQLESGAIYDKHPPLTKFYMVTERLEFLLCLTDVLSQSKSTCKLLQMILLPARLYGRHTTAQRNASRTFDILYLKF